MSTYRPGDVLHGARGHTLPRRYGYGNWVHTSMRFTHEDLERPSVGHWISTQKQPGSPVESSLGIQATATKSSKLMLIISREFNVSPIVKQAQPNKTVLPNMPD